jgi:hypothetical protein
VTTESQPEDEMSDGTGEVQRYTSNVTPGPGGVMTDEVGVVTGELTLATEVAADGQATLRIQYLDADEWYTVTGGHYQLADPARGKELHEAAVQLLSRGGADASRLTLPA